MASSDEPEHRLLGLALNVANLETSKDFYSDVLGMKHASTLKVPGKGIEYVMTMSGTTMPEEPMVVLADLGEGPEPGNGSFGRVVIATSDAEGIARRARARGFDAEKYPLPDDVDMVVYFIRDPDGIRIEVVQSAPRKRSAPRRREGA